MARWYLLGLLVLLLAGEWGCARGGSLEGRKVEGQGQSLGQVETRPVRFTKAADGVITDHTTGLEWYVGPHRDNNWHQAKTWADNLTVAGGGWRLPTIPELRTLYRQGASRNHMDPIFQAPGAWAWSGQMHDARSVYGFAFYSGLVNSHSPDYAYGRLVLAVRSPR
ncbi:MAG: DUF1566 domain-containing protein [Syntrophales bacterium]|nr:DUF1566 domain-containing protein [Syntrophales bacterium]MDD5640856.1 DUF1566 domain-containing protein [Syntrophales bacterium]